MTVSGGATLSGAGTLSGSVTVQAGGIVAPGNGGAGTIKMGSLSLDPAAVLNFELADPAGTSDKITVTGDLSLGGTINFTAISGFAAGTFTLMTYSGSLTGGGLTIGTVPANYGGVIAAGSGSVTLTISNIVNPAWTRTSLGTINGGAIKPYCLYLGTGGSANAMTSFNLRRPAALLVLYDPFRVRNADVRVCRGPLQSHCHCGELPCRRRGQQHEQSPALGPGKPWRNARQSVRVPGRHGDLHPLRDIAVAAQAVRRLDGNKPRLRVSGDHSDASTSADMVAFNDEMYVASTAGVVSKVNYGDGTTVSTWTAPDRGGGSPGIYLPLIAAAITDSLLYVFPFDNAAYSVKTSTMLTNWTCVYSSSDTNCGPAFIPFDGNTRSGTIFCSAGKIYKLTEGSTPQTWAYTATDSCFSGPMVYYGKVYFGTKDSSYSALLDNGGSASLITKWPYPASPATPAPGRSSTSRARCCS